MTRRIRRGVSMTSPKHVRDFLNLKLGSLEHELFCVLLLDKRHRLIEYVNTSSSFAARSMERVFIHAKSSSWHLRKMPPRWSFATHIHQASPSRARRTN